MASIRANSPSHTCSQKRWDRLNKANGVSATRGGGTGNSAGAPGSQTKTKGTGKTTGGKGGPSPKKRKLQQNDEDEHEEEQEHVNDDAYASDTEGDRVYIKGEVEVSPACEF